MLVGVLSIQGGFRQILDQLHALRVDARPVRTVAQLKSCKMLILPGGESTSIGFAASPELLAAVREFSGPVWGICAGVILLADKVVNIQQGQPLVQVLDCVVERNAFGRQSHSAVRTMKLTPRGQELGLFNVSHFIRAPGILSCGPQCTPLAECSAGGRTFTVAVEQGMMLATCFHAEISDDTSWLRYFLRNHVESIPTSMSSLRADGRLQSVKRALPIFLQGGVIMDVVNAEQATVAEKAGACAVMALERIPADIKADGGIARMSDPQLIEDILRTVSIPVMAKARIGHSAEAAVLSALDVDCIDESEVLTTADEIHHINKHKFGIPFVCGAKDLGEALRRIAEGAAMIRLKGNAGTGNVMHAVRHARAVFSQIRALAAMAEDEVYVLAKELGAPLDLVLETRALGRLPVVTFAAGGLATPADVKLLMDLGCDGVFVGSGIFKGSNPAQRAAAIVQACSYYDDPALVAKVSAGLGKAMVGILDMGESYACTNMDSKL